MIAVSACLLGFACRYDGGSKCVPALKKMYEAGSAVPVCPEVAGGLSIPRIPAERVGDRVIDREGKDVTEAYLAGSAESLRIFRESHCTEAVLKTGSPACGSGWIYDGTFSGKRIRGDGVFAGMLKELGIPVKTEQDL